LPGGFLEQHESPIDGAQREIHEELGVTIEVDSCLGFVPDWYDFEGVRFSVLNIGFTATILGGELKADDDIASFEWREPASIDPAACAFPNCAEFIRRYQAWRSGQSVALFA